MNGRVDPRRACAAAAICAALVATVPISDAISRQLFMPEDTKASLQWGLDARAISSLDALESLDRIERIAAERSDALPMVFSQEAGLPSGAHDVRVSDGGNVVGCLVEASEDEAMAVVGEEMCAKSWTEVPLGGVNGATYIKDKGSCRWVLVTCTQVNEETSVVYRGDFS